LHCCDNNTDVNLNHINADCNAVNTINDTNEVYNVQRCTHVNAICNAVTIILMSTLTTSMLIAVNTINDTNEVYNVQRCTHVNAICIAVNEWH